MSVALRRQLTSGCPHLNLRALGGRGFGSASRYPRARPGARIRSIHQPTTLQVPHPYESYEGTPLWRTIDEAIGHLESNRDLALTTARSHVIGYLCRSVSRSDVLFPAAAELRDFMSALSEEAFAAGWMQDLEYALWNALEDGPQRYGRIPLDQPVIMRLRELSERCGGWITFDDSAGTEIFVPHAEWQRRHTAWKASHQRRPA